MAGLSLKHAFVSGVADNATSSEVQPSNWNAEHSITLDQFNLVGRSSAGNGPAQEVPCSSVAMTLLAAASQLAMRAALGQSLTADIGLLQVTGAQIANGTITATQLSGITAQSMLVSAIGKNAPLNLGLTASVGGGSLTVNLVSAAGNTPSVTDPVQIVFRDATSSLPSQGNPSLVTVSAATSITIPSGANMGVTVNGTPLRMWLVAINNGGTVVLGAVVCTALVSGVTTITGIPSEGALITATAISGAATSPGVIYGSTGVSGKAFRIIGYLEYSAGLASAGVYSIAPTTLELFGPGNRKPGDVVQSVFNTTTTPATTTSTSLVALPSGQSQAFVPTSLINPVRLFSQGPAGCGTTFTMRFARNTTLIGGLTGTLGAGAATPVIINNLAYDQPNTLSSVTYQFYASIPSGGTLNYPLSTYTANLEITEIMA